MTKIHVSCSVKPYGGRGVLVPSTRKNPRFAAGTEFSIKDQTTSHLLVKFRNCNSIFSIANEDAKEILGCPMNEFKENLAAKRKKGLLELGKAISYIFKQQEKSE